MPRDGCGRKSAQEGTGGEGCGRDEPDTQASATSGSPGHNIPAVVDLVLIRKAAVDADLVRNTLGGHQLARQALDALSRLVQLSGRVLQDQHGGCLRAHILRGHFKRSNALHESHVSEPGERISLEHSCGGIPSMSQPVHGSRATRSSSDAAPAEARLVRQDHEFGAQIRRAESTAHAARQIAARNEPKPIKHSVTSG